MNGMIKRLMVVMLAVFMVFGMVITPAEAKGGKGRKPQPTPEPTVETEVPVSPAPEENVVETEEPEESEEAAEEELPADETVSEETEPADEEAASVEPVETAVEEEYAEEAPADETEEVEAEISDEEAVEAEEIEVVEEPVAVRRLAADAGLLAEEPAAVTAVGEVPAHTKSIKDNEDGTYTLALNVTGSAEKKTQKVNVIVIIDRSGSMDEQTGAGEITYTPNDNTQNNRYGTFEENPDLHSDDDFFELTRRGYNNNYVYTYQSNGSTAYVPVNNNNGTQYGLVNGEYVQLTRRGNGTYFNPYYWTYGNNTTYNGVRYTRVNNAALYTGQRYTRDQTNSTRLEATQAAVNSLATSLLSKNGQDGNPDDVVEMAMVSFANNASANQYNLLTPTTSSTAFTNAVNGLDADGGTNWEAGLQQANNIDFGDTDLTFAIFFSDGSPTFHSTDGGYDDWNGYYNTYGSGQEQEPNMGNSYAQAVDDAAALARKVKVENFYTIFAYGTTTGANYMSSLTTAAGAPEGNNYSVASTSALQDAFDAILDKIEMAGIGNVEVDDGTTNHVEYTDSTGAVQVAELLEVNENSFRYWRAGGEYGTGNDGKGTEWTGEGVPKAELVDGEVQWDLSSLGVLENGVTYTVTFDVYPSQYTYDTIAQLKNGDIQYSDLPEAVRTYLKADYTLLTNTTATLHYDDTRDEEGRQDVPYNTLEPVATNSETLTINKEWSEEADVDELEITVLAGDEPFHTATISKANGWKTTANISLGVIKDDVALRGALGHDFSFAELGDEQYRWELDAPIVRPMLVDGEVTMLVKVDAKHPLPSGAKTYTIEDSTYYVDEAATGLTATNIRRSYLDVKKAVVSNGPKDPNEKDVTFEFTMKVENSRAKDSDPENTGSDYYVWFSVYDVVEGRFVDDAGVVTGSGIQPSVNDDGETYYYVPSGNVITVKMKTSYSVRFLNLPSGSKYEVTEAAEMPNDSYSFAKIEGGTVDSENQQKVTGTIEKANDPKTVTVTNEYTPYFYIYHSSNNTVEKISFTDERVVKTLVKEPDEYTYTFNIVNETNTGHLYGGYFMSYGGTTATDAEIISGTFAENGTKSGGVYPDQTVKTTGFWKTDAKGSVYDGSNATAWKLKVKNSEGKYVNNVYTEKGTEMSPVAGTVYYLKEIPDQYFRPALYYVYDDRSENKDLKKLYMLVPTDDSAYNNVGADGTVSLGTTTRLYTTYKVTDFSGNAVTYNAKAANSKLPRGYLTVWDGSSKIAAGTSFDWTPYLTTKDGVKVTSVIKRTIVMGNAGFEAGKSNKLYEEEQNDISGFYVYDQRIASTAE